MGFRSLQHIPDTKVHNPRALPARFVPSSGFGCPLDGFLPSHPGRFCFAPAALMGFTLRSVLRAKGAPGVSAVSEPTYRCSFRYTLRHEGGRPARKAAVSGPRPFERPLQNGAGLAHRPPDAPLGFSLPGFTDEGLLRDFARNPLTRFPVAERAATDGASEYRSTLARPPPPFGRTRKRLRQPS
jgi:hypothetical protein